jgi:hypothetical protein
VGLALGGQLFAQDGDQLRFISRPTTASRTGQQNVHPASLPFCLQSAAFDAITDRALAYAELVGGLRYG